MKIAYFLDLPHGLGGAGNLLLQQAVLMSKLHEVLIVIPADRYGDYNKEYARRCECYNIPYVCLEYVTSSNFSGIDFVAAMMSVHDIEELVKKEKIEFLHSVQLNIAVEYVAREMRIPHLMDIYQLEEEEFKLCPGDIYPHFHLCDSILYSKRWGQCLGIESRCIRPIALLDSIKRKSKCKGNKISIIMLGILCARKNQMAAIKAIEQCVKNGLTDIELHIAGDINNVYGEECIKYVEKNKLKQQIVFHGFVSDIVPLLEKSDCLLCSSIEESFPSSIVEAITYGLIIISTPVAGVPELFKDKGNAFISENFYETSISKSILECVDYFRSGKISAIREKAEETWKEQFSRDTIREKIDTYYSFILSNMRNGDLQSYSVIEKDINLLEEMLKDMKDQEKQQIQKKLLYFTVLQKKIGKGKMYIWGAGKLGKLAYEIITRIRPDLAVEAFIDTHKSGCYCNVPVKKPEEIFIEKDSLFCISFAKGREEAIQYFEARGLQLNKQIWIMP